MRPPLCSSASRLFWLLGVPGESIGVNTKLEPSVLQKKRQMDANRDFAFESVGHLGSF